MCKWYRAYTLYGTEYAGVLYRWWDIVYIPPVLYPVLSACTVAGYHLVPCLIIRLLSLALRRYVFALSSVHPKRVRISEDDNLGFASIKAASWRCAGLSRVVRVCAIILSRRRTSDWRSPLLPRLHAQQEVTRLSGLLAPPSASATLWSTSRSTFGAPCPQYWQVKESLANISHRSLYHPFNAIRLVTGKVYGTGVAMSRWTVAPLYCNIPCGLYAK